MEDVDKAIANLNRLFAYLRERLAGAAKPVLGEEAARDVTVFTTEASCLHGISRQCIASIYPREANYEKGFLMTVSPRPYY